ncbi:MAG: MFS transporter [Bacteroidia bacterium]
MIRSIYTAQFWLLCLSSFLFFASFNMIIPELPGYLSSMGGQDYIGLIIFLFALTAGISRPFSGKLTDRIGRIPVMVAGAVVAAICGAIYPWVSAVWAFLLLRFFHGFSTGFKPTGTVAYLADIVPANRRGEAIGVAGLSGSLGMASGPALGSWLAELWSLDLMFYASSASALLSVLILAGMKETLSFPEKFKISVLRISWADVYQKSVVTPSLIMMLTVFSFGIILTIIPDYSEFIGLTNKGWFFTVFTLSSVGIRFFAGKASDKFGRINVMLVSTSLLMLSMILIALSETPFALLSAAVVFGVAAGMNAPTLFAWAIDLSDKKYFGRAMATLYIALEIGVGSGALISGTIYSSDDSRFPYAFSCGAITAGFALIFLIWKKTQAQAQAGLEKKTP